MCISDGRQILVVEDDPTFADILAEALEAEGWVTRVCVVDSAEGAIALNRERFDAIVLDINLRDSLTGIDVAQHVRSDPQNANVPIIVVTGTYNDCVMRSTIRSCGVDAVLPKPLQLPELIARLELLLPPVAAT